MNVCVVRFVVCVLRIGFISVFKMKLVYALLSMSLAECVSMPFTKSRLRLLNIMERISIQDIGNFAHSPSASLTLSPPTLRQDQQGFFEYLFNPTGPTVETHTDYQQITTPLGTWNVVTLLGTNRAIAQLVPSGAGAWVQRWTTPKRALLQVVDAASDQATHPLVRDYAFMKLLRRQHIAVQPYFLSPPVAAAGRKIRRFMLTKHYPAGTLQDFLAKMNQKPFPLLVAFQMGWKVFDLIHQLHSHGITHGRICMANVVFARSKGAAVRLYLSDFSEAKLDERGVDATALNDLRMFFVLLMDMNIEIGELAQPGTGRSLKRAQLAELVHSIYEETSRRTVSEVDYNLIDEALKTAIQILTAI